MLYQMTNFPPKIKIYDLMYQICPAQELVLPMMPVFEN